MKKWWQDIALFKLLIIHVGVSREDRLSYRSKDRSILDPQVVFSVLLWTRFRYKLYIASCTHERVVLADPKKKCFALSFQFMYQQESPGHTLCNSPVNIAAKTELWRQIHVKFADRIRIRWKFERGFSC